jgi:hypothetical protein
MGGVKATKPLPDQGAAFSLSHTRVKGGADVGQIHFSINKRATETP